jgi:hypothetical protein
MQARVQGMVQLKDSICFKRVQIGFNIKKNYTKIDNICLDFFLTYLKSSKKFCTFLIFNFFTNMVPFLYQMCSISSQNWKES